MQNVSSLETLSMMASFRKELVVQARMQAHKAVEKREVEYLESCILRRRLSGKYSLLDALIEDICEADELIRNFSKFI